MFVEVGEATTTTVDGGSERLRGDEGAGVTVGLAGVADGTGAGAVMVGVVALADGATVTAC